MKLASCAALVLLALRARAIAAPTGVAGGAGPGAAWPTGWLALGGAVLLVIAAGLVVARRAAQRRHARTRAEIRALLEAVPDVVTVHRRGSAVYANTAARELFGFAADAEVAGLGDRVHPDDATAVTALLRAADEATCAADEGTRAAGAPARIELRVRVRDADGGWRTCELSGASIELAGETVRVVSGRDVTERDELRARLDAADRTATRAAGVAHDLNNPLSYVLGNLQLMAEVLEAPFERLGELSAAVRDATEGAERVRVIVQGLRSPSPPTARDHAAPPRRVSDGRVRLAAASDQGAPPARPAPVLAVVPAPAPVNLAPPASGRSRVLVVDDEPQVTEMLARVLRREHEVVAVSCGRDAIEQIGGGVWFDAIVSDVMMPHMTGLDLLDELVRVAPEQAKRLIFLSGGVFTPETRARLEGLGTMQLQKPISTQDLRNVVRHIAATRGHP